MIFAARRAIKKIALPQPAAARSPTPLTARARRSRASTIELLPARRCRIAALHRRMPYLHLLPPDERVARLAAPGGGAAARPRLGRPRPRPGTHAGGAHASPPAVGRGADQAARRAARGRVWLAGHVEHQHTCRPTRWSAALKAPAPPQTRTPAPAPPHRIPSRSHAHRCLPRRRDDRVQKLSDQYEPRALAQRDSRHCLSTKVLFCRSTS